MQGVLSGVFNIREMVMQATPITQENKEYHKGEWNRMKEESSGGIGFCGVLTVLFIALKLTGFYTLELDMGVKSIMDFRNLLCSAYICNTKNI